MRELQPDDVGGAIDADSDDQPLSPLSPKRQGRWGRPRRAQKLTRAGARSLRWAAVRKGCCSAIGNFVHRALAGAVFVLTSGVLAAVAAAGGRGVHAPCVLSDRVISRASHLSPEEIAMYTHGEVIFHLIGILVTAPVACWLLGLSTTSHLCRVSEYALLMWLQQWTVLVVCWMECAGDLAGQALLRFTCRWVYSISYIASIGYLWWIFRRQMHMLEASSFIPTHSQWLWRLIMTAMCVGLYVAAMFSMTEGSLGAEGSAIRIVAGVAMWVLQILLISALMLFLNALWRVLRLTMEAWSHIAAVGIEEGQKAPRSLRFQMVGSTLSVLSTSLSVLCKYWAIGLLWPIPAPSDQMMSPEFLLVSVLCLGLFDTVANTLASLALSGAVFGALSGGRQTIRAERARQEIWRRSREQWAPHPEACWQAKVQELAGRGISLQALVDFYRGLGGDAMPHFDPLRHTTEDVVRGAIIPLSAARRQSMAEVLMSGGCVEPETMVTHNWGNLFVDMVAAIVSSTLGEKEYCRIAYVLIHDVETLQTWIDRAGVAGRTFWVCAFSVNQHYSICSVNPDRRRDSVSGEEYALCACGAPKAFNRTPPLSREGHSVDCELNKFDPMMLMLSQGNRSFSHLVAVDKSFDIFTRAWCIAEVAAAHSVGMRQSLQLPSRSTLERKHGMLAELKITDMRASRPEDREEILSRIADHDAFDRSLRALLLDQLIPSWSKLDSSDQLLQAGRIARLQLAARASSGGPAGNLWEFGALDR